MIAFTSTYKVNQCKHRNGIYHRCRFDWFIFHFKKPRQLFCTDCMDIVDAPEEVKE